MHQHHAVLCLVTCGQRAPFLSCTQASVAEAEIIALSYYHVRVLGIYVPGIYIAIALYLT